MNQDPYTMNASLAALNPARYLVAGPGLPPIARDKLDYVMAGNGLWKRAANRHLEVCACLAPCHVPGLPNLPWALNLAQGSLPQSLLHNLLADARRRAWSRPTEAMYHVRRDETATCLVYVAQHSTAAHVSYRGGDAPAIILDAHSHCELGAYFSGTDDRDEQGFRFYLVIGRIFTHPEARLRLGIHGDFWPEPLTSLFDGPGPFADLSLESWED